MNFNRNGSMNNIHNVEKTMQKYQQLAKDAQSNGDPVLAQNYLQHADHYLRRYNELNERRENTIEKSIPEEKILLKSNISLTLFTYHISQTNQHLSTNLHQPDFANPFQNKKTPSDKQRSTYPIYLSHQPDRSEPTNTSSSARLYQSIADAKATPSEK